MRLTEANMMLNDKNKRLDEFCQTVAHDIRGPLGGLIMRLEYLNDKFDNITKVLEENGFTALAEKYKKVAETAKNSDGSISLGKKDKKIKPEEAVELIDLYLDAEAKEAWWQMIQLLGSNYNQTRNVMMNYEVLANIYKSRKNHKLDEWREICKWIEELSYSELIIGEKED